LPAIRLPREGIPGASTIQPMSPDHTYPAESWDWYGLDYSSVVEAKGSRCGVCQTA